MSNNNENSNIESTESTTVGSTESVNTEVKTEATVEPEVKENKIVEEPKNENANPLEIQGICGVIRFICPQINDYFNGYEFKKQYYIDVYNLIENNFNDYINILKYLLDIVEKKSIYKSIITKERLSVGWNQQIIKKVYDQLLN